VRFRLDETVRDRILAETNGNPLALLELPRGLDPAQLAGGLGLVGALPVPARIEQGFRRRLDALPADTRSLMLVAAAEPAGDMALVWQAAGRLGIPGSAAEPAQADGLLEIGARVRFRHPLVRSAVYSGASLPDRRAAHRALADVTDRDRDPGRRAWHLAAAAIGPDDEVAAELERSAGRAQARGGIAAAAAFLQRAVELTGDPARRSERAVAEDDIPLTERLRCSRVALAAAALVWDQEHWRAILARDVQSCREAGMLTQLALYLGPMAVIAIWRGDLAAAASLAAEEEALAAATGARFVPHAALILAGFRGNEAEAAPLIEAVAAAAQAAGQGSGVQMSQWITTVLCNGLGRYEAALEQAQQAAAQAPDAQAPELYVSMWVLPELIEAASRTRQTQLAADALDRLAEATSIGQTDWGQGIYARSRALLSEGAEAERWYREAADRLGRTGLRCEIARTHLLYGEWLRREARRTDARAQLRAAHDMFTGIGMQAFAERAGRELLATGATARKRTVNTRDDLTPQEAQIARLARDGLSSPEIATQLFISPRTVQYHLGKVFAKLDVTSRNQLNRVPLSRLSLG
jgi:DNA-binding CsgD family transcriptional regulator